MFIATLTFIKGADDVAALRERHAVWLTRHFDDGLFVASGPRPHGAGGVVVVRSGDGIALDAILAQDPYVCGGAGRYDVVEFTPVRTTGKAEVLKSL